VSAGGYGTTSNSSGAYTIAGVPNGAYTVKATKAGYTCIPSQRPVTINGASVGGVNFQMESTLLAPTSTDSTSSL
jgi:hypothetical protein